MMVYENDGDANVVRQGAQQSDLSVEPPGGTPDADNPEVVCSPFHHHRSFQSKSGGTQTAGRTR